MSDYSDYIINGQRFGDLLKKAKLEAAGHPPTLVLDEEYLKRKGYE